MNTIFFSDVHLNVAEDGRERMAQFARFLRRIDPACTERVVVVGDLFDFWFEYEHVIFSGYFDVLRAFADLADAGVELYFCCGNHDFWAGRFLRNHLKFSIHTSPLTLQLGPHRVQLVHGDGIDPKDRGYRVYKWIARARPVVWLFSLLHPDWAMALAQAVARGSRHMFKADDVSQGSQVRPLQAYAKATLAKGDADVVMCGHSHYPVMEEHPTPSGAGLYINTGDWLFHRSYVEWDGERFSIRSFEEGEGSLGPPRAARETQHAVEQH
ncbi:MAG: UDP-2,3-diacylglucosamine diphosphatase [Candidatus Hydrogenedentes bacterium]|nr:UDP-2,3-diacylglucosamine diphosphatase [Candidatus Hydrogenedentota bacterium]